MKIWFRALMVTFLPVLLFTIISICISLNEYSGICPARIKSGVSFRCGFWYFHNDRVSYSLFSALNQLLLLVWTLGCMSHFFRREAEERAWSFWSIQLAGAIPGLTCWIPLFVLVNVGPSGPLGLQKIYAFFVLTFPFFQIPNMIAELVSWFAWKARARSGQNAKADTKTNGAGYILLHSKQSALNIHVEKS